MSIFLKDFSLPLNHPTPQNPIAATCRPVANPKPHLVTAVALVVSCIAIQAIGFLSPAYADEIGQASYNAVISQPIRPLENTPPVIGQPLYPQPLYPQSIRSTIETVVTPPAALTVSSNSFHPPATISPPGGTSSPFVFSSGPVNNLRNNVSSGLAQRKAKRAAEGGIRGHLGGGLGGARFEGVGWSNQSAQRAIESCCYWGTRPTAQIGVAKGGDGFWYACVLYH